jgi:hypothetical protein
MLDHRPIGTGRLRARRRFGYWGEQIGRLRDQSSHHFGARRQNSSLQQRVGVETAMENVEPVVRRLIAKEQHQGRGFESLPRYFFPLFPTPNHDFLRFRTLDGSALKAACHVTSGLRRMIDMEWPLLASERLRAVRRPTACQAELSAR